MGIFLSAMDQMVADGLQFIIHFVWFDHVGPEGVPKGVSHCTHDAILKMNQENVISKLLTNLP